MVWEETFHLRSLFYIVTPNETSYKDLKDVPNFVSKSIPYFICLIVCETLILTVKGKNLPRINDSVNSISHGILSQLQNLILYRPIELVVYVWLYERFHFIDLPWDEPLTWILGFIFVDFAYYWFHRFSHECSIIWSSHQVHHSSEDYNLSTALRQSLTQNYYSMFFNFPMAFWLPPSVFYVHKQFNLLYQFWIHTEAVDSLGPLEYILNTPSHHRVHHGRNPYCIDKNYGGTLIVWDRLFNTFKAEKEEVVYGLLTPNPFWNPLFGQFFYYIHTFERVIKYPGFGNKMSAILRGPGWEPKASKTDYYEQVPEIKYPVRKYDNSVSAWISIYILIHFAVITLGFSVLLASKPVWITGLLFSIYVAYSLQTFGLIFDNNKNSSVMELVRCLLFLAMGYFLTGTQLYQSYFILSLFFLFLLSALLWTVLIIFGHDFTKASKKLN